MNEDEINIIEASAEAKHFIEFFSKFLCEGLKNALFNSEIEKTDIMLNIFMACLTNVCFNSIKKENRKEFFVNMVKTINMNLQKNDEKFGDIHQ